MSMTFKQAWWTKIMASEQEEETKTIKERERWLKENWHFLKAKLYKELVPAEDMVCINNHQRLRDSNQANRNTE